MARKKGSKNITITNRGTKINQYGVRFTQSEWQEFNRLVRNSNAKRKRIRSKQKALGPPSYLKYEEDIIFGPNKASTSLNKFKNKGKFNEYVHRLKRYTSKGYSDFRTNTYRSNLNTAIRKVFGDIGLSRQLRGKLNKMSNAQFRDFIYKHGRDISIDYIYYDPENNKLKEMNKLVDNYLLLGG